MVKEVLDLLLDKIAECETYHCQVDKIFMTREFYKKLLNYCHDNELFCYQTTERGSKVFGIPVRITDQELPKGFMLGISEPPSIEKCLRRPNFADFKYL